MSAPPSSTLAALLSSIERAQPSPPARSSSHPSSSNPLHMTPIFITPGSIIGKDRRNHSKQSVSALAGLSNPGSQSARAATTVSTMSQIIPNNPNNPNPFSILPTAPATINSLSSWGSVTARSHPRRQSSASSRRNNPSSVPIASSVISPNSLPPIENTAFASASPSSDEISKLRRWLSEKWEESDRITREEHEKFHSSLAASAMHIRQRKQVNNTNVTAPFSSSINNPLNGSQEFNQAQIHSLTHNNEEEKNHHASFAARPSTPTPPTSLEQRRLALVQQAFHEALCGLERREKERAAGIRSTGSEQGLASFLNELWSKFIQLENVRTQNRLFNALAMASDSGSIGGGGGNNQPNKNSPSSSNKHKLREAIKQATQFKVDLEHAKAELEAKQKVIENLQAENDADLLYSNQLVCSKEMNLFRVERALANSGELLQRSEVDRKILMEEKINLEINLKKLEDEKEEIIKNLNIALDHIQSFTSPKTHRETQWDPMDLPRDPLSKEDVMRLNACVKIQSVFRGFRARKTLRFKGLIPQRVIQRRIRSMKEKQKLQHKLKHKDAIGSVVTTATHARSGSAIQSPSSSSNSTSSLHSSAETLPMNFQTNIIIPRTFRHLISLKKDVASSEAAENLLVEDPQNHSPNHQHPNHQHHHHRRTSSSVPSFHFVRIFTRQNLLKFIQKIYQLKIIHDQQQQVPPGQPGHQGHQSQQIQIHSSNNNPTSTNSRGSGSFPPPPRKELADFIYTYYVLRHGTRDAAEMDLLDLFASVSKNVSTSSRVRIFSNFLHNSFQYEKLPLRTRNRKRNPVAAGRNSNGPFMPFSPSATPSFVHPPLTPRALLLLQCERERASKVLYNLSEKDRGAWEIRMNFAMNRGGISSLSERILQFSNQLMTFIQTGVTEEEDQNGAQQSQSQSKTNKPNIKNKSRGKSNQCTPLKNLPVLHGPFQTICDDNNGVMWVDRVELFELFTGLMNKFPVNLREKTMDKMRRIADGSQLKRNQVLNTSKDNLNAIEITDQLQQAQQQIIAAQHSSSSHPNGSSFSSSSSAAPPPSSSSTDSTAPKFVDYDSMLEILIEAMIEEDARLHYLLYELFLEPQPQSQSQSQSRSSSASASRNRDISGSGSGSGSGAVHENSKYHHLQHSHLHSRSHSRSYSQSLSYPIISDSNNAEEEIYADPEILTFSHFVSVLRNQGCSSRLYPESRLLEIYLCAIQRASYRSVHMEDLVYVVRNASAMGSHHHQHQQQPIPIMTIQWDFECVTQTIRKKYKMMKEMQKMKEKEYAAQLEAKRKEARKNGQPDEDEDDENKDEEEDEDEDPNLPSLNDDDDPHRCASNHQQEINEEVERLKEQMREMETIANRKVEAAYRRHEKELIVLRQTHERDMAMMVQAQQAQQESNKYILESERHSNAQDYNSLFETTQIQITQLQHKLNQAQEEAHKKQGQLNEKMAQRLNSLEESISLLQSKLSKKNDKLQRKKDQLAQVQHQLTQAQQALAMAGIKL